MPEKKLRSRKSDSDAGKFSAKVPELEHQATLAFDLAEAKLKNVVDAASVYQDLNEVAKLARRMDDSPTKAKILLGLAYQYEKINHGFALEELSEAIRVINKLKDPDLFSSSFSQIVGRIAIIRLLNPVTILKTHSGLSKKRFHVATLKRQIDEERVCVR